MIEIRNNIISKGQISTLKIPSSASPPTVINQTFADRVKKLAEREKQS